MCNALMMFETACVVVRRHQRSAFYARVLSSVFISFIESAALPYSLNRPYDATRFAFFAYFILDIDNGSGFFWGIFFEYCIVFEMASFLLKTGESARVAVVLGGQWGDEGKGKLADVLAANYDITARFNGGNNAGHTVVVEGKKYAFHLLPCGLIYPHSINLLGNGVVLHLPSLFEELEPVVAGGIDVKGRLKISDRCHLLFDFHRTIDGLQEKRRGGKNIGTTKKGIGPAYSSKATRNSVRVGQLKDWDTFVQAYNKLLGALQGMYGFEHDGEAELAKLKALRERVMGDDMIVDGVQFINRAYSEGKKILAEGANAAMLDLDFGTYPYVTSSTTTAGGVSTGLGLAPSK